jgi:aconitase A
MATDKGTLQDRTKQLHAAYASGDVIVALTEFLYENGMLGEALDYVEESLNERVLA